MGMTNSHNVQYGGVRKYSDEEIKKSISKLFDNNKHNMVETSYSLDGNLNITSDQMGTKSDLLGGDIKFNSLKNRHLRHNIESYIKSLQKGGVDLNATGNAFQEIDELDKIKQILEDDMKNDVQTGGDMESSEVTNDNRNKVSFLDLLFKGGKRDNDDDDFSTSIESDSDSDDVSTTSSKVVDGDVEMSPTSIDSKINKPKFTHDTDKDDTESSSMEASVDFEPKKSDDSESSNMNILPFYTSSSSDVKHPYTKNRFNM